MKARMFTLGVTGTNGKTSTTWMLAAPVRADRLSVLRISTLGVALDDEALPRGKRFSEFVATLEGAAARGCQHAVQRRARRRGTARARARLRSG